MQNNDSMILFHYASYFSDSYYLKINLNNVWELRNKYSTLL